MKLANKWLAYSLCKGIAAIFLALVAYICAAIELFGYEETYWVCVFFFGLVYQQNSIEDHEKYIGYGVAKEINEILDEGNDVLQTHELALSRLVPKKLLRKWGILFYLFTTVGIAGGIMYSISEKETIYTYILSVTIIGYACIVGEIYVWLAINRVRLWYCDEEILKKFLHQKLYATTVINEKIAAAKNNGLIG